MRALGQIIPSALVRLLQAAPVSQGKVEFAWSMAVGNALQRATNVRLDGNRLMVDAASTEWVREITRARPIILQRLQAYLGEKTVAAIEVRAEPNLRARPAAERR
jgi:predicted nucleic acid-binding Zn ribbon protein